MRRACLVFSALALPGCFTLVAPPSGYEMDEIACADGRDNDQDHRIDCMDEDCVMRGFCGEYVPLVPLDGPEDNFFACRDGIDNDGDGQFDCGDRSCQSIGELCCAGEFDDRSCSDRFDNESNGFTDCADFTCRNNPFVTVCASETACYDRDDADGNGSTVCTPTQIDAAGAAHCTDGVDNDGDRLADRGDPDCDGWPREVSCADGVDNNNDGRFDCSDVGCAMDPACAGPEDTLARCTDGIDNDGDDFIDCDDFACAMNPDPMISGLCTAGPEETTLEQCTNMVDDDLDDFPDCQDFSCQSTSSGATPEAAAYCAEHLENTLERCSDGSDNDGNGFIDCADFSCSRSNDAAVVDFCALHIDGSMVTCRDHIDNDGNGFTDCADFGCNLFLQAGWGFDLCDDPADCGPDFACTGGLCLRACSGGDCPLGTQCTSGFCVQTCLATSECDAGETCYRDRCLAIRGPCNEGLVIDGDVVFQAVSPELEPHLPPTNSTAEEQIAMVVAQCSDGVDNDRDFFIDCEDWECNYNPLVVNAAGRPLCRSAGGNTCALGPLVGSACGSDVDCGGASGACQPGGAAGSAFVCP